MAPRESCWQAEHLQCKTRHFSIFRWQLGSNSIRLYCSRYCHVDRLARIRHSIQDGCLRSNGKIIRAELNWLSFSTNIWGAFEKHLSFLLIFQLFLQKCSPVHEELNWIQGEYTCWIHICLNTHARALKHFLCDLLLLTPVRQSFYASFIFSSLNSSQCNLLRRINKLKLPLLFFFPNFLIGSTFFFKNK